MALQEYDSTASRAFHAIQAVASTLARARSGYEVAQNALQALEQSGLIEGGALEVSGFPPVRCMVGRHVRLLLDESLRAELDSQEQEGARSGGAGNRVMIESVPTLSSPPATLYLFPAEPVGVAWTRPVAEQIAVALDRAYLQEQTNLLRTQTERRIRDVSTIYEIGRAIDTTDVDRLLEIITEKVARAMDAQACSLMRLNPDTNAFTIAASYGLPEDVVQITHRALGEGIAGRVAQTGEPMLIADAQNDPRLTGVTLRPDIGSSMVVPMKDEQEQVIGVLSIRRLRPAPDFDEDDLRLFLVFASQAAWAITKKHLYDDLRRRNRQLSTLSELTLAVISHLDLNSLLESVADSIVEVVKFDRCAIFLLDRATRRFTARIMRGYRPEVIGRNSVRLGEGVIGIVAKKQMPIVEKDARNALQPIRGFARSLGTDSFIAIPIISRGQSIGVVVADNKLSRRSIHDDSIELLCTFANQAGLAIENAQLYEDREQRYQEMNRLATQTDNILRSIAASVVVVDTHGKVIRWNKASEEMWGIPEEMATSCTYFELVDYFHLPPEEAQRLRSLMEQALITGKPSQEHKIPLHPQHRDEVFINVLLSPLIDRQGIAQGVVQIMEDLTREVETEMEMIRIRRLADIGALASKMAHEVRNPLSSIKGAAQLMRNEYAELGPLREFLDIIIDEVNGLSRITTDLLEFARPIQLDLRWTNLNHLAERTMQFLAGYLSDNRVAVLLYPDPDQPDIYADPKQIEQVMRNIVINAVQAMPEGGRLTISTGHDTEAQEVTIRFTDTGIGIPPDKMEQIFQPFFTTKTKGTGLGLSIVSKIVENHGGRLAVSSRMEEGTTFAVTLPLKAIVREQPESVLPVESSEITFSLPDAER